MADVGKAYLQILPSMQGFQQNLENGGTPAIKGAGNKWSGVLKASLAVGAVSALAKGFVGLIKLGGEYEQVTGGVQKIFDKISYKKIEKDGKNAYKSLNISSKDYQKNIVTIGSMLKANMGQSKAYDIAKRGMQVVSDLSTATGRDIETLNEKWAMLNRSSGTYQSIADNFSGILPQTSVAFLEQAQAAGFLSDNYKKLSEVPMAEYQEALTKMAEKGTEDLGILGNTAKESEKTLTGSFEAMKSSWTNLLTEITSGGDVTGSIKTLFSTLKTFLTNLGASVATVLASVGTAIYENVTSKFPEVKDEISAVIKTTVRLYDKFKEIFKDIGEMLGINGKDWETVRRAVAKFIEFALIKFEKFLATLELIADVIQAIVDAIKYLQGKWDTLNASIDKNPIAHLRGGMSTAQADEDSRAALASPVENNYTINVTQAPGMSADEVVSLIERRIKYANFSV